jgi:hypothetical protein
MCSTRMDLLDTDTCSQACKFRSAFISTCVPFFYLYVTFLSLNTSLCMKYFLHRYVDALGPGPPPRSMDNPGYTTTSISMLCYVFETQNDVIHKGTERFVHQCAHISVPAAIPRVLNTCTGQTTYVLEQHAPSTM